MANIPGSTPQNPLALESKILGTGVVSNPNVIYNHGGI